MQTEKDAGTELQILDSLAYDEGREAAKQLKPGKPWDVQAAKLARRWMKRHGWQRLDDVPTRALCHWCDGIWEARRV